MHRNLAEVVLPVLLAGFTAIPAVAQIRVGVDIGALSIRMAPEAPPPLRREVRYSRPSREHVWIQGYWDRRDERWAWSPGRWEQPTQQGSTWVRARYREEGGGWRYEPAHWSHQRMEEGDDYRQWHEQHGRGRGHEKGRGEGHWRDHDKHHDQP